MSTLTLTCVAFLLAILTLVAGETTKAKCEIKEDTGEPSQKISGTLELVDDGSNTKITGKVIGFSTTDEYTEHGFHVHVTADMSEGCKNTEGHYNPTSVDHAGPDNDIRHVGDLGNVMEVDGEVTVDITDKVIRLGGSTMQNVMGKPIVIHEKADDFVSQPTGAAGSRLGCCLIELVTSSANQVTLSLTAILLVLISLTI